MGGHNSRGFLSCTRPMGTRVYWETMSLWPPVVMAHHLLELEPLLVVGNVRKWILHGLAQIAVPPQRHDVGALLVFLKEEAKKEDQQLQAMQANTKRFLDLLEKFVKKNKKFIILYLFIYCYVVMSDRRNILLCKTCNLLYLCDSVY